MANYVAPRGFVPVRYLNGAAWNGAANIYYIPSTDTNQYSPGDAVVSANTADVNGIPAVTKATGTATVRGVIVGVQVTLYNNPSIQGYDIDLTTQAIPAAKTKGYYVLVVDDPQVLFQIQDDGLNALTASAVGQNASFTVVNPTAPQQNSASVLASGTVATTASLNLKIMSLMQQPNNAFGVNANWVVKFNQHELQGNTAGI